MTPDAYDSSPPRGSALAWTRVYKRGGRYAHLRRPDGSQVIACSCADGTEDCWLGTGSQAEYEHAAALPLHPGCFAVREAARLREGYDPADPGERPG